MDRHYQGGAKRLPWRGHSWGTRLRLSEIDRAAVVGQWQIDLDAAHGRSNLLAVLTIQLMIRIADKDGFAICSICHRSYVPKRRPTATKRNYCDDAKCRRQVWKHLKRQQRESNKHGRTKAAKTR
jgi:hypothetical protein